MMTPMNHIARYTRPCFATAMKLLGMILMLIPINAVADTEHVGSHDYAVNLNAGDTTYTVTAGDTTADKRNRIQRLRDNVSQRISNKINEPWDTTRDNRYWWRAMKHGKVDFNDPTMGYPKFVKFCYNAYKWGDRAFNSYDTAYVVSTGKNWKLQLKNQNWLDDFISDIDNGRAHFISGAASNIGLYLSFMAISVGYSIDVDRLFGGKPTSQRFEFSFTCARFTAEAHKTTNYGRMKNRVRIGGGEWKTVERLENNALRRETKGASATYFFNNKKYARAAAYCFSKYQLRSAGSALAGFSVDNHDFKLDPERLTPDQKEAYSEVGFNHVRYTDYCLSGGYAYNWVISRKFLLNVTGIVGGGVKHIHSTEGRPSSNTGALKMTGNFALTFNHKRCFASLQSNVNTNLYVGKDHFSYTITDITAVLGLRF